MQRDMQFSWYGRTGDVRVDCVANDDPAAYGCWHTGALGYPVCTATVHFSRRGYRSMFGWVQLVRSTDNESRGDQFEDGAKALDEALDAVMKDTNATRGLVIDVRLNGGGADPYGVEIAGRLTDKPYVAFVKRARNDPADPDRDWNFRKDLQALGWRLPTVRRLKARTRDAMLLLDLQSCAAAYAPTELPQGVSGRNTLGDGTRLMPYTTDKDGVKEFHIRMAPITWTTTPGNTQTAYAFNGTIPGPVIRVNEGDRLRIVVTNALPVPTSVHWHGMILPNDQDGVPGITQPLIQPGSLYTYQWTAVATGTHWYHTHTSGKEVGLGLYGALEIVPRQGDFPADRDYRVMIGDTDLGLVLNGKSFPYTYPLKAKVGERVHIRLIETGDQVHPIHIHGFPFQLVARDGIRLAVPEWMDTTLIGTGQTLDLIWQPMSPGNWMFHCHIFAHSHDDSGMMGLVTVFEVAPSDSPVPGVPPPLPALPTPNMVPGYGAPPVTLPPSGGTLLPSLPAAAPVQPQSGGLLGGNQNAVLIGVGLLLAYRLGGRFGHPRRGR